MLGRGELMHDADLTVGELLRHSDQLLRKLAALFAPYVFHLKGTIHSYLIHPPCW